MLSREDLLLFERKFSDINIIATSMILIYYLLFIMFGNLYLVDEIYTAAGFVAVVLVDFIDSGNGSRYYEDSHDKC